jgi:hypothetical protein
MLGFWLGGICGYTFVPVPAKVPAIVSREEGISAGRRYPIDDEEILEFLQAWTIWNDVE